MPRHLSRTGLRKNVVAPWPRLLWFNLCTSILKALVGSSNELYQDRALTGASSQNVLIVMPATVLLGLVTYLASAAIVLVVPSMVPPLL